MSNSTNYANATTTATTTNQKPLVQNPLDPLSLNLTNVAGIHKLSRQITKEIKGVIQLKPNVGDQDRDEIDHKTNLAYLLGIVKLVNSLSESEVPSAVLSLKTFQGNERKPKLSIDVISKEKDQWYKVSGRNPRMLTHVANGGGSFNQKSILDHAEDYMKCAEENLILFKPPKVNFYFVYGIGKSLADDLQTLGINVIGARIEDKLLWEDNFCKPKSDHNYFEPELIETNRNEISQDQVNQGINNPSLCGIKKLNLDITALLCYVSNLTNGHSGIEFQSSILKQQARDERMRPQKPILDKIFEGRDLYCCETAFREFNQILSIVGGDEEKLRTKEFVKNVKIFPDNIPEKLKSLELSGQVKNRSLTIFGSGEYIEAVTVTANYGFVRASRTKGIDVCVFIIESRALTEQKELAVLSNSHQFRKPKKNFEPKLE